jgi:hypothetical protein
MGLTMHTACHGLALHDVTCYEKLAMSSLAQQRIQGTAQQPAKGTGNNLSVVNFVGVEPFETNQKVKRVGIAFDVIACRPTSLPRTTASDIVRAPLPKGGSFLNHG